MSVTSYLELLPYPAITTIAESLDPYTIITLGVNLPMFRIYAVDHCLDSIEQYYTKDIAITYYRHMKRLYTSNLSYLSAADIIDYDVLDSMETLIVDTMLIGTVCESVSRLAKNIKIIQINIAIDDTDMVFMRGLLLLPPVKALCCLDVMKKCALESLMYKFGMHLETLTITLCNCTRTAVNSMFYLVASQAKQLKTFGVMIRDNHITPNCIYGDFYRRVAYPKKSFTNLELYMLCCSLYECNGDLLKKLSNLQCTNKNFKVLLATNRMHQESIDRAMSYFAKKNATHYFL